MFCGVNFRRWESVPSFLMCVIFQQGVNFNNSICWILFPGNVCLCHFHRNQWLTSVMKIILVSFEMLPTYKNSLIVSPFPEMYIGSAISMVLTATSLFLQLVWKSESPDGTLNILMSFFFVFKLTWNLTTLIWAVYHRYRIYQKEFPAEV